MIEPSAVQRLRYAWHVPYRVTLGETYARFFEGLRQKKILGNLCQKCGGLYVPARPLCDRCFEKPDEWVETDGSATLESFTVTYAKFLGLPPPPNITGIIRVADSVTNLLHFVSGIEYKEAHELEEKLKIGMRLRPVWNEHRTGDMLDIAFFTPV
jgi:uncharacterized OB-fold protein